MRFDKLFKMLVTGAPFTTPSLPIKKQKPVDITPGFKQVIVKHMGHKVLIKRKQNNDARIPQRFTKTSRPCPPFCVQPIQVAPDVETIAELEILAYLDMMGKGDESILLIDSRMENWVEQSTIPSAISIPWTKLVAQQGATTEGIIEIFSQQLNIKVSTNKNIAAIQNAVDNNSPHDVFDFTSAKTLILFCNGPWCGQTSKSINVLLHYGYPPEKLKYYRGGVQGWVSLGFTTASNGTCISCNLH